MFGECAFLDVAGMRGEILDECMGVMFLRLARLCVVMIIARGHASSAQLHALLHHDVCLNQGIMTCCPMPVCWKHGTCSPFRGCQRVVWFGCVRSPRHSRRRSKRYNNTWVTAKSCAVALCSHRLAEQSCVSASKKQHLAHLLRSVRIPLRRRWG